MARNSMKNRDIKQIDEKKQPKANRSSREMKVLKLLNILREIRVEIAFRKEMPFKKLDHNQRSWELTTC